MCVLYVKHTQMRPIIRPFPVLLIGTERGVDSRQSLDWAGGWVGRKDLRRCCVSVCRVLNIRYMCVANCTQPTHSRVFRIHTWHTAAPPRESLRQMEINYETTDAPSTSHIPHSNQMAYVNDLQLWAVTSFCSRGNFDKIRLVITR